jgi:hypothetical protein
MTANIQEIEVLEDAYYIVTMAGSHVIEARRGQWLAAPGVAVVAKYSERTIAESEIKKIDSNYVVTNEKNLGFE